jgi:hypothetical protein
MSFPASAPRVLRVMLVAGTLALTFVHSPVIRAQNGAKNLTPAPNYELAAQWTSQKVSKLVFDTTVTPRWLSTSDRFWYSYQTRDGRRFSLVDPIKKTKSPLFDHAKMAATLTSITRIPYDAQHLPFTAVRFVRNDTVFEFDVQVPRDADVVTKPKKVITTEQGSRGEDVEQDEDDMVPGEENVALSEVYVFDREAKSAVRLKADRFKDQTLSVSTKPQAGGAGRGGGQGGGIAGAARRVPAQWLGDSASKFYITRLSRDMHKLDVCIADTTTGDVKPIIEERLNTYIETKPLRLVNNGQELLFWSERDGWGHFYLYDANSGALKNRITEGEFVATGIEAVDEKGRVAYITAGGREKGEDPYYTHLYRVGLDGSGLKLLDPGDATHAVVMSESARYFVDNASRVNGSPESVLYDTMGTVVTKLETPDLGALLEVGFK